MSYINELIGSLESQSSFNEETMKMFWEMYYTDEDREETPQEYASKLYNEFELTEEEYEVIERNI